MAGTGPSTAAEHSRICRPCLAIICCATYRRFPSLVSLDFTKAFEAAEEILTRCRHSILVADALIHFRLASCVFFQKPIHVTKLRRIMLLVQLLEQCPVVLRSILRLVAIPWRRCSCPSSSTLPVTFASRTLVLGCSSRRLRRSIP